MTKSRKKKSSDPIESEFDESLARFIQTDPKELADALEQVRQKQEEVRQNVEKRRDSIERGARRSKKRFRL
jgi:hypothetical protein